MPLQQVMYAVSDSNNGGQQRLRLLKQEQLDRWITGERHVPNTKILALIDLLDRLGALGDEA